MDERAFIERKQESWNQLTQTIEKIRASGPGSLTREQLTSLGAAYRAVVSDLSFARSQGASERLICYLNEISGRAHGALYSAPKSRSSGVVSFLLREFPALFRATFRYTLVASLIFFIGWGISYFNADVRNSLVPAQIHRPAKGSENDSPLADIDPALISSFIMTNNIQVGIIAFAGGITAGFYTVYELMKNGLMIGAVVTKAAPVLGPVRFWSLILPHGVIELTAIFLCGGAGLMIGSAIIAPGNLRRADALRIAAMRALRLFAGAVALFAIAGTIEGFVTPSALPAQAKLAFAGLTAIALTLYLGFAGSKTAVDGKAQM